MAYHAAISILVEKHLKPLRCLRMTWQVSGNPVAGDPYRLFNITLLFCSNFYNACFYVTFTHDYANFMHTFPRLPPAIRFKVTWCIILWNIDRAHVKRIKYFLFDPMKTKKVDGKRRERNHPPLYELKGSLCYVPFLETLWVGSVDGKRRRGIPPTDFEC